MKEFVSYLKPKKLAILIYALTLLFFMVKVNYYDDYVGNFPDESSHLGYVAYLDGEDVILPDYHDMYTKVKTSSNTIQTYGTNYLGHPPLYYNILNLFNDIEVDGENVTIDVSQLRFTSQCIAYLGLIIAFLFGLNRIKKNSLHLLYATILTSVPMFAYTSAGVNNDTLAFTGMVIFAVCFVRLLENRNKYSSYILFASSIFILMMTKVTAGLIALIACAFVLIYIFIKEKSFKILFNKYFAASLPIYILVFIYYMGLYLDYGTFQISLAGLDKEYFVTTDFYTDVDSRIYMNIIDYAEYYFTKFLNTWISVQSHVSLSKLAGLSSIDSVGILSLTVLPLMMIFTKKKSELTKVSIAVYLATGLTIAVQFVRCYFKNFLGNGYLGGFQSRYYICAIIFFAFAICFAVYDRYKYFLEKSNNKKRVEIIFNAVCILFSALLIYEDFIYFIINFDKYL